MQENFKNQFMSASYIYVGLLDVPIYQHHYLAQFNTPFSSHTFYGISAKNVLKNLNDRLHISAPCLVAAVVPLNSRHVLNDQSRAGLQQLRLIISKLSVEAD
jgi:hypothetical protein